MDYLATNIFVVTCPESGWDCVIGAYKAESEEDIIKYLASCFDLEENEVEDYYVIHHISHIEKIEKCD